MLLQSENYRDFLSAELVRRIRHNPRYSQRAFARQLRLSPGELSELLRGKRKLSLRSALRVSKNLGLSPGETKHLLQLIQTENTRAVIQAEGATTMSSQEVPTPQALGLDVFALVSEWYCFAILNLAECDDFCSDENWIAKRLGISNAQVRLALERLERVGLVRREGGQGGGKIRVTPDVVLSPDGIPSEAIRSYHKQILQKAIQALDVQSVAEREISGLTLAVNPNNLPSLKKEVSQFLDQLAEKYASGKSRKEVYQCEIALFRLSEENQKRA